MTQITGKTALITGGAAGIGKLMGKKLIAKGLSKLIIWDINPGFLEQTAIELTNETCRVFPYLTDVSDTPGIISTAKKVSEEVGNVDILINNAGVVVGRNFIEHTHEDIDFTMQINTSALMHVALEFLPGMIANGSGHIVNISSAAGLLTNPKMSVYVGSKWGVTGWSESLRIELEQLNRNIRVLTVNPSYINTGMFAGVKTPLFLPILEADSAATKVIRAIEKNRIFLRMPFMVNLLPFTRGILPIRAFDWLAGRVLGVYESMADFAGHDYFKKPEK